jgi:uncharacterized NAD(P)/FAD-binding protein YdhS
MREAGNPVHEPDVLGRYTRGMGIPRVNAVSFVVTAVARVVRGLPFATIQADRDHP